MQFITNKQRIFTLKKQKGLKMLDPNEKPWHLSQNESEKEVTDFELQLWRVFYGFIRWQEECEKNVNNTGLVGNELAVLHVVRMKDKPKTISDIARILNRTDMYNINYSLRKLLKKGLVKKNRSNQGVKTFVYEITPKGIENTTVFSKMRRNVLVETFMRNKSIPLKEMASNMLKIKSVYDEADSIVAYTTLQEGTAELSLKEEPKETIKKIKK